MQKTWYDYHISYSPQYLHGWHKQFCILVEEHLVHPSSFLLLIILRYTDIPMELNSCSCEEPPKKSKKDKDKGDKAVPKKKPKGGKQASKAKASSAKHKYFMLTLSNSTKTNANYINPINDVLT